MRVIVTGGSGLIGRKVSALLATAGHEVIVLSRKPGAIKEPAKGTTAREWDARSGDGWFDLVNANTVIINLAGEPVAARRWTEAQKKLVLDSRLDAARAVVDAIRRSRRTPRLVLQASAVGYYGDRGDEELTELSKAGTGFLADVARQWEKAIPVAVPGRRAFLRFGVVLSRDGGAFPSMLRGSRFLTSRIGSGRQWVPWVHEHDVAAAVRFLMLNDMIAGPFNVVAPEPVTNAGFMKALAKVRHMPAVVPAPAFALKRLLGEMSEAVLASQRVTPRKLLDTGFEFRFDTVEAALADLMF